MLAPAKAFCPILSRVAELLLGQLPVNESDYVDAVYHRMELATNLEAGVLTNSPRVMDMCYEHQTPQSSNPNGSPGRRGQHALFGFYKGRTMANPIEDELISFNDNLVDWPVNYKPSYAEAYKVRKAWERQNVVDSSTKAKSPFKWCGTLSAFVLIDTITILLVIGLLTNKLVGVISEKRKFICKLCHHYWRGGGRRRWRRSPMHLSRGLAPALG